MAGAALACRAAVINNYWSSWQLGTHPLVTVIMIQHWCSLLSSSILLTFLAGGQQTSSIQSALMPTNDMKPRVVSTTKDRICTVCNVSLSTYQLCEIWCYWVTIVYRADKQLLGSYFRHVPPSLALYSAGPLSLLWHRAAPAHSPVCLVTFPSRPNPHQASRQPATHIEYRRSYWVMWHLAVEEKEKENIGLLSLNGFWCLCMWTEFHRRSFGRRRVFLKPHLSRAGQLRRWEH